MTTVQEVTAPVPAPVPAPASAPADHRGSPIPTVGMIATRFMELRKRRGLMIALILVNIGIPTVVLLIRLISHAVAPKSYEAAGGYDVFTFLVSGLMYTFGFIVAAAVGCTAGSSDLTDGMFRHLVVTGRSRVALYLARIPAGMAVVVPMVAVGFTIVCGVCVFAAPSQVNYNGANIPPNLSQGAFMTWAGEHPAAVICNFPYNGPINSDVNCGGGPGPGQGITIIKGGPSGGTPVPVKVTPATNKATAIQMAKQNYSGYKATFQYPSTNLMVRTGLWLELEAIIGLIVGLGLGSLIGQRTVPVIVMIVFQMILTPLLATHVIPHIINLQRALVGLATAHIEPAALPLPLGFGGGQQPNVGPGHTLLVPESHEVAVIVICAWLVGFTAIGAWRMVRRDA